MKKRMFFCTAILVASLCIPNINANANQQTKEIKKEEIAELTNCLKVILAEKKNEIGEEVKNKIIDNGWDYDKTISALEEANPFKEVDYISVLSAYMSCKNYYSQNSKSGFTYLAYLPLLSYELSEEETEEFIPVKIDTYSKVYGTNKYIKEGTRYLVEETRLDKYELGEDGFFRKNGKETLTPQTETIKYGKVDFSVMTAEDVFEFYGLTEEQVEKEYKARTAMLSINTTNSGIYQSMFARTPQIIQQTKDLRIEGYNTLPITRQRIAEVANSLKGEVPYLWGGKALKPGYDPLWWTFDDNNNQRGLDCSGYVQWVYWTAGYPEKMYSKMLSTVSILNAGFPEIDEEDLQVGDIGVKVGAEFNHTGIYLGKIDGKDQWIHCASKQGTVVISEFNFHKFYSPLATYEGKSSESIEKSEEIDLDKLSVIVYPTITESQFYSDEDVYTLAQLIVHEAGGEGLNGWVAVAEVVKNRINSPLFPNTLQEVVYQDGQFSYVHKIASIVPSQEIIDVAQAVLEGRMSIFNEPKCLHYRNPMITSDIPATEPVDWGKLKYHTYVGNHAFYLNLK